MTDKTKELLQMRYRELLCSDEKKQEFIIRAAAAFEITEQEMKEICDGNYTEKNIK